MRAQVIDNYDFIADLRATFLVHDQMIVRKMVADLDEAVDSIEYWVDAVFASERQRFIDLFLGEIIRIVAEAKAELYGKWLA